MPPSVSMPLPVSSPALPEPPRDGMFSLLVSAPADAALLSDGNERGEGIGHPPSIGLKHTLALSKILQETMCDGHRPSSFTYTSASSCTV